MSGRGQLRLFISYNTRDEGAVRPVVDRLKTQRPDADIYFAPTRNVAGSQWIITLGEELEASDAVLLFLGPNVGPWQEIEYYEAFRRGRGVASPRIIPILLEDEAPGLHFLGQLHRLAAKDVGTGELLTRIGVALDGVEAGPDAVPLWRETNPYRGLHAMESSDAAFFFGREALTGDLLERLRGRPDKVQLLVGNSGTGKSSIVEAGVVAALRSQVWPGDLDRPWPDDMADSRSWQPVRMTPGREPLKALASAFIRIWTDDSADREALALKWAENFRNGSGLDALIAAATEELGKRPDAGVPARLLLNIDQGEELYVRDGTGSEEEPNAKVPGGSERKGGPTDAETFSRLIADAVKRRDLLVIGSLRSDYYGRLQEDRTLFEASDAHRRAAADPGAGRGRHPQAGGRPRRAVRRSEDRADDRRGDDAGRRLAAAALLHDGGGVGRDAGRRFLGRRSALPAWRDRRGEAAGGAGGAVPRPKSGRGGRAAAAFHPASGACPEGGRGGPPPGEEVRLPGRRMGAGEGALGTGVPAALDRRGGRRADRRGRARGAAPEMADG